MKPNPAICFALLLGLAAPLAAQEDEAPPSDGGSLMERGAELFLRGLRDEMAPRIEEFEEMARQFGPQLQGFLEQMGPALGTLMEEVQDWSLYEAPEVLPNGDILIRRKPDPDPAPDTGPEAVPDDAPPGTTDI